jgi:hypothetical protein
MNFLDKLQTFLKSQAVTAFDSMFDFIELMKADSKLHTVTFHMHRETGPHNKAPMAAHHFKATVNPEGGAAHRYQGNMPSHTVHVAAHVNATHHDIVKQAMPRFRSSINGDQAKYRVHVQGTNHVLHHPDTDSAGNLKVKKWPVMGVPAPGKSE